MADNPEVSTQATQDTTPETPTVESLQSKINELTSKLTASEKGLQTAHRTLTEKDRALKEAQDVKETLNNLKIQMDVLKEYIPTPPTDDEALTGIQETPKRKPIDARLAEVDAQNRNQQIAEIANEAEKLADEANLDIETSPELRQVRRDFRAAAQKGDVKAARDVLEKTREIADGLKEKNVATEKKATNPEVNVEEITKKIREEVERDVRKKYGIPEGGTAGAPSVKFFTQAEIDNMSTAEYLANKDKINKQMMDAIKQGKFS